MRLVFAAALGLLAVQLEGQEIQFTQVASGIAAPTDIQNAGDGSGRLFVVRQNGIVRVLRDGVLLPAPFLDITSKTRGEGERGLLGLAFPPGFAQSGRFYVNYTDLSGDTVIAQYRVSSNPDLADPASEIVLLRIDQPFANHNGGQLRFGPDGYLWIGMGDGGSAGDPRGYAQNLGSLLGKMLRVDVESDPGRVRIPPDNPFVNTPGAGAEIWAYGLRNPWRFSFDRLTRDLWIGDVGQNEYEEVHFAPASSRGGENYGWNIMEGLHCFRAGCSQSGLVLPVAEYSHGEGCSVTGGFAYRGNASPGLRGTYVYGDYCSGVIWGVSRQGSGWLVRRLAASGFEISTFGEDEAGELYVANASNGTIHRINGSPAPSIVAAGVVNAASFVSGLSPGSLSTVFAAGVMDSEGVVAASQVPLATSLADVAVTVNGVAAPLHVVANINGQEQVNFQAPFEIVGLASATVVVSRAGRSSVEVTVPVAEFQPGVYTSDGTQAIVVRGDYTLVTPARPLLRGESVFLYATGLGRVSNQPRTGSVAPLNPPFASTVAPVEVTIGGMPGEVQFAGLAPGFVGVYQVNFRVAPNAPAGTADLVVRAGGAASPAVKVPVQ
jgi:uncharacterized protein (TIGR03437 family)